MLVYVEEENHTICTKYNAGSGIRIQGHIIDGKRLVNASTAPLNPGLTVFLQA